MHILNFLIKVLNLNNGEVMATYKIGNSVGMMNFDAAYQIAENGDIFEFERGYKIIKPLGFEFDKSISIIGSIGFNDKGQRIFTNLIEGFFIISENVTIIIENFWLSRAESEYYMFNVLPKASLMLDSVFIDNSGETLGLINTKENSVIRLVNIESRKSGSSCLLDFSNSTISIIRCTRLNSRIFLDNSDIIIKRSTLNTNEGNLINAKNNSIVKLHEASLESLVDSKEDTPAIWIEKSKLSTIHATISQKNYHQTLYLTDLSELKSEDSTYSSVIFENSIGYLNNSIIKYAISLFESSFVKSNGELFLHGELDINSDIYLSGNSVAVLNDVIFDGHRKPNLNISENSFLYIDKLKNLSCDYSELELSKDDTSRFILENKIKSQETININALEQLNSLVGLRQVKAIVEQMVNQVKANKKRIDKGLKPMQQNLNAVFLGNPGTGKTTVARLLGRILFDSGALFGSSFKFIEVSEPDLISQNIGGTAIQTKNFLDEARGGILFIDEAYALCKKDGSGFGQEAINTIMKYMEDYRDEIMIIFAGYTKEMEEFLRTNPGLISRVPNRFIFEDYTPEEIVQLGLDILTKDQFILEDKNYYFKKISKSYERSLDKSNGRWIRNINEAITKEQFSRVVKTDSDDVETILNIDIDNALNLNNYYDNESSEDALLRLNQLIGITRVKRQVQEFIYQVEANKKKEEMGIAVDSFTLHSLFLGNPGTGKTTVARIVGKILFQKGIISSNKFIEVSRSDLIAGYVGQTATKTRDILQSALGGVLFIDEAYTLNSSSDNDFGKESIDEILKFMEDHRGDIVIIFAGYTDEMNEFLKLNPGLKSRIPTVFNFEDYSTEEIIEIGLLGLKEYKINNILYSNKVKELYEISNDKSNARWIRNFNEKLLRLQSSRLIELKQDSFDVISDIDINEVKM